jgi:HPt (histidine-containing phosphotransfer) domain-containing protein
MDLLMPVMDGYEATRRLRADQRYFSLPLVAMTAHAMVEERERCLALGMNGHLSKPIEPEDLYATLARYYTAPTVPVAAAVRPSTPPVATSEEITLPTIDGLDTAGGLRRAGNNRKLYRQMLDRFASDFADCNQTFAEHLANAKWEEAERLAHTLKGLAGTLGANDVQLPAGELEAASKSRQAAAAAVALAALTAPLIPLLAALQQCFAAEQAAAKPADTESAADAQAGRLPDCLPQLRKLLAEGDSDAIDLWEKHHKEFAQVLSPQVAHRIGTALQNFEFDAAKALLDEQATVFNFVI